MKRRKEFYTHDEIANIGQRYYNDTNFCTVVAMAHAAKVGFGKVFNAYKRKGRPLGKGGWLFNNKEIQKDLGITAEKYEGGLFDYVGTVGQVVRRLPKGAFWLLIRGHIIHVEDNVTLDWVKSNSKRRVNTIYKITRHFEQAA